jgi:OTU domain-containing protein 6
VCIVGLPPHCLFAYYYCLLCSLQEEYAIKLQEMEQRHKEELAAFTETPQEMIVENKMNEPEQEDIINIDKEAKERKQSKARRKREQQLVKQKQLEEEQERDLEGPSARKEELQIIQTLLKPLGLKIQPVASDGHCLYRAVAEQIVDKNYLDLRKCLYIRNNCIQGSMSLSLSLSHIHFTNI